METKSALYEQAIINVVRSLPIERVAQVLDFAIFIKAQQSMVTPPNTALELDEHVWGQIAIRSLAKYWDTPEEDEAWAHL
jgi:hypothetical protein